MGDVSVFYELHHLHKNSALSPVFHRTAIADRDALTQQNTQMWASAPQQVQKEYGKVYFSAYLAKLAALLRLSSKKVHQVVEDLSHAVTAAHPYTRYVPALFTYQIPADCFATSPNLVQDFFIHREMKVSASPAVLELDRGNHCGDGMASARKIRWQKV